MALTRSFSETVAKRARCDPAFRDSVVVNRRDRANLWLHRPARASIAFLLPNRGQCTRAVWLDPWRFATVGTARASVWPACRLSRGGGHRGGPFLWIDVWSQSISIRPGMQHNPVGDGADKPRRSMCAPRAIQHIHRDAGQRLATGIDQRHRIVARSMPR